MTTSSFFSFYLILNSYVPLDLIVVIEIAKMLCTPFITADAAMKHVQEIKLGDNRSSYVMQGCEAHTLNLHEELAAVEYIFADKTGTLTQNELVFKELSIFTGESFASPNYLSANYPQIEGAHDLFRCIALCQDCIAIKDDSGSRRYTGPSVDEVSLLDMMQRI